MREGARGINDYLSLMAAQGSSAMKQMISKEKRAQIIAALKDNPNAAQIAREVGGVGYRTVVRLAEGAGIELTAGKAAGGRPRFSAEKRSRFSAEKRALIIAALKDNPKATQIAQEIGSVSHTTVGKIAKAAGIALAAAEYGKRLSAEKRTQIVDALKANPNAAEVAKQIGGVTRVRVWKIAKAAGIELTAGKAARNRVIGHRRKLRDVVGDRTSATVAERCGPLVARAGQITFDRQDLLHERAQNRVLE